MGYREWMKWTSEAQWKPEVNSAMLLRVYFQWDTQGKHQDVRRLVPGQHPATGQWLLPGVSVLKKTRIREALQNTALLSLPPHPHKHTHTHTSNLRMDITFILFYFGVLPKEIWSYTKDKTGVCATVPWSWATLSQGGDPGNVPLFHYLSLWVTRCFLIVLKALQKPPSLCPLDKYRKQFCTDFVTPDSFVLLKMPSSQVCATWSLVGSLLPNFPVNQAEGVNAVHACSVTVVKLAGFPRGTDVAWRVNEDAFKYF